jgi:hypothetical protein
VDGSDANQEKNASQADKERTHAVQYAKHTWVFLSTVLTTGFERSPLSSTNLGSIKGTCTMCRRIANKKVRSVYKWG